MRTENNTLPFPVKDLAENQRDQIVRYISRLPVDERPKVIDLNKLYVFYDWNWIMQKLPSGAFARLGISLASELLSTSEQDSLDTKRYEG